MSQLPPRRSLLSLGLPKNILVSLMRNGYETVQDLNLITVEILSRDLNIPMNEAETLFARLRDPQTPAMTLPPTQSVAVLVQHSQKITTNCTPLDTILEGGLSRGQILEISGPPGSPKEKLATGIVASFAEAGEEVIFVDCQNMVSSVILAQSLKRYLKTASTLERIHHTSAYTLPSLLLFMHQLEGLLKSHPKISLLVINSISFPFQVPNSGAFQKHIYLDKVRQSLSKAGASHNLTIVTTSQLAMKMLNADGTPGNFETGAKGIMVPSLGPAYLPSSKAHRVILAPDGLKSGVIKLLSSPKHTPQKRTLISEPYSVDSTGVSFPAPNEGQMSH